MRQIPNCHFLTLSKYRVRRPLTVHQRGSCPSIQAAPAATKGLAWQPKPQKRPRQRGSPQKTGVSQKGAKRERHLLFLEGKGIGRYCT
eukprot:14711076-Ditylum_brightwellii.AAC.1